MNSTYCKRKYVYLSIFIESNRQEKYLESNNIESSLLIFK